MSKENKVTFTNQEEVEKYLKNLSFEELRAACHCYGCILNNLANRICQGEGIKYSDRKKTK